MAEDEEETLICPVCGSELDEETGTCPECGLTKGIIELEDSMDDIESYDFDDMMEEFEKDILEMNEDEIYQVMKKFGSMGSEGVEGEEIVIFECPVCGEEVGEDATECPGCGAIFEEAEEVEVEGKKGADKFEVVFDKAKIELAKIRKSPISEDMVKDLIRQSALARKEENYEKGIERAREAVEICKRIEIFLSNISKAKDELKELKEEGEDYKTYMKGLLRSKKLIEKGDIEEGLKKSKKILADIHGEE